MLKKFDLNLLILNSMLFFNNWSMEKPNNPKTDELQMVKDLKNDINEFFNKKKQPNYVLTSEDKELAKNLIEKYLLISKSNNKKITYKCDKELTPLILKLYAFLDKK